MPYKYVIEMFCDMVAAGQTYQKEKWTLNSPIQYYEKFCYNQRIQHHESEGLLIYLFEELGNSKSLDEFFKWYRKDKKRIKQSYENTNSFLSYYESFKERK